jgi:hypothetical protein
VRLQHWATKWFSLAQDSAHSEAGDSGSMFFSWRRSIRVLNTSSPEQTLTRHSNKSEPKNDDIRDNVEGTKSRTNQNLHRTSSHAQAVIGMQLMAIRPPRNRSTVSAQDGRGGNWLLRTPLLVGGIAVDGGRSAKC